MKRISSAGIATADPDTEAPAETPGREARGAASEQIDALRRAVEALNATTLTRTSASLEDRAAIALIETRLTADDWGIPERHEAGVAKAIAEALSAVRAFLAALVAGSTHELGAATIFVPLLDSESGRRQVHALGGTAVSRIDAVADAVQAVRDEKNAEARRQREAVTAATDADEIAGCLIRTLVACAESATPVPWLSVTKNVAEALRTRVGELHNKGVDVRELPTDAALLAKAYREVFPKN